jgi:ribosomal protein L31
MFKDANLKVVFKTITTAGKLLSDSHPTNTYEQSGIYKMTCQSCHNVYIGQPGLNLTTRYNENINMRFNKDESAFAQHTLEKGHQYRSMEQIMELIEYARNGNIMNIKENYYIYKFKQLKELTEEQKSTKDNDNQNSLFDIALRDSP